MAKSKPRPQIPDDLLAQLAVQAAIIRGDGEDSRAWDNASEEFDRLMTTAVKIDLVMEIVDLRGQVEESRQRGMERDLAD